MKDEQFAVEPSTYSELLSRVSRININTDGVDENILNQQTTPGMSGMKRPLFVSPSTPVGKHKKGMRFEWMEGASPVLHKVGQGISVHDSVPDIKQDLELVVSNIVPGRLAESKQNVEPVVSNTVSSQVVVNKQDLESVVSNNFRDRKLEICSRGVYSVFSCGEICVDFPMVAR